MNDSSVKATQCHLKASKFVADLSENNGAGLELSFESHSTSDDIVQLHNNMNADFLIIS